MDWGTAGVPGAGGGGCERAGKVDRVTHGKARRQSERPSDIAHQGPGDPAWDRARKSRPDGQPIHPSGGPVDTSQALEALMTALTTLSGQLERERIRAYKAEAALVEAQAAQRAA